jgi:hypothetical protein
MIQGFFILFTLNQGISLLLQRFSGLAFASSSRASNQDGLGVGKTVFRPSLTGRAGQNVQKIGHR